eukprot:s756_g6.t1
MLRIQGFLRATKRLAAQRSFSEVAGWRSDLLEVVKQVPSDFVPAGRAAPVLESLRKLQMLEVQHAELLEQRDQESQVTAPEELRELMLLYDSELEASETRLNGFNEMLEQELLIFQREELRGERLEELDAAANGRDAVLELMPGVGGQALQEDRSNTRGGPARFCSLSATAQRRMLTCCCVAGENRTEEVTIKKTPFGLQDEDDGGATAMVTENAFEPEESAEPMGFKEVKDSRSIMKKIEVVVESPFEFVVNVRKDGARLGFAVETLFAEYCVTRRVEPSSPLKNVKPYDRLVKVNGVSGPTVQASVVSDSEVSAAEDCSPQRAIAGPGPDSVQLKAIGVEHIALDRKALFPRAQAPYVYAFDDLSRAELEMYRRRAKIMNNLFNDASLEEVDSYEWLVADVTRADFGEKVSDEAIDEGVILRDSALVEIEGEEVYVVRINVAKKEEWMKSREQSKGDPRLLGHHTDGQGRRHLDFRDAIDLMTQTEFDDWPLSGPRACLEFLKSVRSGSTDLITYHLHWSRNSGVSSFGAAVFEHRTLCDCLKSFIQVDQIDVSSLLGAEYMVRRLIQIETAVTRNPQAPDYSGLDVIMESGIGYSGEARALKFQEWVGTRLKERAQVQKNARLYKEEFGKKQTGADGGGNQRGRGRRQQRHGLGLLSESLGLAFCSWRPSGILGRGGVTGYCRISACGLGLLYVMAMFGETLLEERRHGYLFPIPGGVVQREHSLVRDALKALNRLAGSKFNDACQLFHRPANSVQSAAVQVIRDAVAEAGPCPCHMTGQDALKDMMKSHPLYGEPSTPAPFSAEKLKILKSTGRPKPLRALLPPAVLPLLNRWKTHIEMTPEEVNKRLDADPGCCPARPYWDPVLKNNKQTRTQLIVDLWKIGVISFRQSVKSHVGLFFVKKKDPAYIRMVVDCRIANAHHRSPPVTRLGSGANFTGLDLSDEMLEKHFGNTSEPLGFGCEMDVSDCFYQFALPECAKWFGINDPRTCAEWSAVGVNLDSVFDADAGAFLSVGPQTVLYPVVNAMPMGWTWALFFANETVSALAGSNLLCRAPQIREKLQVPQLWEAKTLTSVYVDNVAIFGAHRSDVEERIEQVNAAFSKHDIPVVWSYPEAVQVVETVGVVVDFQSKMVRNKSLRLWKIYLAGREICKRSRVRAEVASALIWCARAHLGGSYCREVDMGDSSGFGYAMTTRTVDPWLIQETVAVKEKWRFISLPEEVKSAVEFLNSKSVREDGHVEQEHFRAFVRSGVGIDTEYGQWLQRALEEGSWLKTSPIVSQLRAKPPRRADIEIPQLVKPVSGLLLAENSFKLLWMRKWRNASESINIKEARVCLSSLKRSARNVRHVQTKKLTLCDNLSAVLALEKGRSSSRGLNRVCKTACATQIALQIRWYVRHVETKRNQADKPSRGFMMRNPVNDRHHNVGRESLATGTSSGSISKPPFTGNKKRTTILLGDLLPPPGLGDTCLVAGVRTCQPNLAAELCVHSAVDDHGFGNFLLLKIFLFYKVSTGLTSLCANMVKISKSPLVFLQTVVGWMSCMPRVFTVGTVLFLKGKLGMLRRGGSIELHLQEHILNNFAGNGLKRSKEVYAMLRRSVLQSKLKSLTGSSSIKNLIALKKKTNSSLTLRSAQQSLTRSRLATTAKPKLNDDDKFVSSRKRKRERTIKCNVSLPKIPHDRRLQCSKVKPKTLKVYHSAVQGFLRWNRHSLSTHALTDEAISAYIHKLCEDGKTVTEASYVVFGWILLKSRWHLPDKMQLPVSRQALKGWRARFPGTSRTGVDLALWDLVALGAIQLGFFMTACAILIQGDCYLRPCETLQLTRRHLLRPQRRVKSWGVVVGLQEDGVPSKNGEFDECVFADTECRGHVNVILKGLFSRSSKPDVSIFYPLVASSYNQQIADAAKHVGLAQLKLTSHRLRHSGASHDAYYRIRKASQLAKMVTESDQLELMFQRPAMKEIVFEKGGKKAGFRIDKTTPSTATMGLVIKGLEGGAASEMPVGTFKSMDRISAINGREGTADELQEMLSSQDRVVLTLCSYADVPD